MNESEADALYRAIGERVKAARDRQPVKLSQAALAEKLGVSRASIVNIEAGRQHAPLYLLWQIAQQLDTEVVSLIPTRADLAAPPTTRLSEETLAKIKEAAAGDSALELTFANVIGQAVHQLTNMPNGKSRTRGKA